MRGHFKKLDHVPIYVKGGAQGGFFQKGNLVLGGYTVISWLVSSKGSESRIGPVMLQAKNMKAAAIFKLVLL